MPYYGCLLIDAIYNVHSCSCNNMSHGESEFEGKRSLLTELSAQLKNGQQRNLCFSCYYRKKNTPIYSLIQKPMVVVWYIPGVGLGS